MSPRKVNKPRVSLRTKMIAPRQLHPMYRGVVPMLLRFDANFSELDKYPPEMILKMIGIFMNTKNSHMALSQRKQKKLRSYLKSHNIADWTREPDGAREHSKTVGASRRRKDQGE